MKLAQKKRKNNLRTTRTRKIWKTCWERRLGKTIQTQRTSTIPRLHLKNVIFINPDESWSSKTEISAYDQQICPDTFPFLLPFVRCPSEITVEGLSRSWKPEMKPRRRRLWKIGTKNGIQPDGISHPGPGLLHSHVLPDLTRMELRRDT